MPKAFTTRIAVLLVAVTTCVGLVACGGGDDETPTAGNQTETTTKAFGAVQVSGSALPTFDSGESRDSAVNQTAPVVTLDRASGETGVIGGAGRPSLVVFVAHWCPHCQAEVPVIVQMAKDGKLDNVRLVAVATGTNAQAPNYPPVAWLTREGWPSEVLLDDEDYTAAQTFGLSSYPYLVAISATGTVTGRASGELKPAAIEQLAATAGAA